jgi:hypothetical protein
MNTQERVLAYTLATLIDSQCLDEVAGGAGPTLALPSLEVTGSLHGTDVILDK